MIWPFRRKQSPPSPPASPTHIGPKTVDWVPGDIAECIWPGPWWHKDEIVAGPALGSRAMVVEVFLGSLSDGSPNQGFALRLVGMARGVGWNAVNFRKVVLTENGADRAVRADTPVRETVDA